MTGERLQFLILVMALVLGLTSPDSDAQCWVYVSSGTSNDLLSIAFADSLHGTAVGAHGIMLGTTDGGMTWTRERTLLNIDLLSVSFFGGQYGAIIGDTNVVLTTTNGGTTWYTERVDPAIYYLYPLAFSQIDALREIAYLQCNSPLSYSGIYVTSDAGATWTKTSTLNINQLSFGTSLVGTGLSYYGAIRTTDGGMTWNYTLGVGNLTSVSSHGPNIAAVAGVSSSPGRGGIWRTDDGGQHWNLQDTLLPQSSNYVCLGDSSNSIVVSQSGDSRLSTDAGQNWISLNHVPFQISAVASSGQGKFFAVGQGGTIIRTIQTCIPLPVVLSPLDGALHQSLTQDAPGHFHVQLQWNYPDYTNVLDMRIRAGTDSNFTAGIILDSTLVQGSSPLPESMALANLFPGQRYFWQMRVDFIDSTSTGWNQPWKFSTGASSISGSIFNDLNNDGVRNPGEPGFAIWRINAAGKVQETVLTDSLGNYSIGGLDSGTYIITQQPPPIWKRTFPSSDSYLVTIGIHDSVPNVTFGNTYPWNIIEGTIYRDLNGDGVKNGNDLALVNWQVSLYGPDSTVVTNSDSSGHYIFPHVLPGTRSTHLSLPPGWEQVIPRLQQDYPIDIQTYGNHYSGVDFSVERTPVHAHVMLTVNDNFAGNQGNVWFGIRPGASYGISGVDANATGFDFLEGEFEIPPHIEGLFDARFIDPHGGIRHFGLGSWTDVRDFTSVTQTDTFQLFFAPGFLFGGDYPMTIRWSTPEIKRAFNGPVTMVTPDGTRIDMVNCACDTLSTRIVNPSFSSVLIITQAPNIPDGCNLRWNLISIPEPGSSGYIYSIFGTATTHGFSYTPGLGYAIKDTMYAGVGYWIKDRACEDSIQYNGIAHLLDTLELQQGWNLIGSLSAPLAVDGVQTIPVGILSSSFFGYEFGYSIADTLFPTKGYWIKSSTAGKLVLNAVGHESLPKARKAFSGVADTLIIEDAAGNHQDLFITEGSETTLADSGEAPPRPPDGCFDVRFSSDKYAEVYSSKSDREFQVSVEGAMMPLRVSWKNSRSSLNAFIESDGKRISVSHGKPVEVSSVSHGLFLILPGGKTIPSSITLFQNYPNPFNPSTTIRYFLPSQTHILLKVYDVLGRIVYILENDLETAGIHEVEFSGARLSSGIYFYRLEAGNYLGVKKMLILK